VLKGKIGKQWTAPKPKCLTEVDGALARATPTPCPGDQPLKAEEIDLLWIDVESVAGTRRENGIRAERFAQAPKPSSEASLSR